MQKLTIFEEKHPVFVDLTEILLVTSRLGQEGNPAGTLIIFKTSPKELAVEESVEEVLEMIKGNS